MKLSLKLSIVFLLLFFNFSIFSQDQSLQKEFIIQQTVKEIQSLYPDYTLSLDELKRVLLENGIDIDRENLNDLIDQRKEIQTILQNYIENSKKNGGGSGLISFQNRGLTGLNLNNSSGNPEFSDRGISPFSFQNRVVGLEIQPNLETDSLEKDSTEISRKIYGHDLFKNYLSNNIKDFSPRDNFIISPNDLIEITLVGKSQYYGIFEVNSSGFIYPEGLPRIFISGKTWSEAKKEIRKIFSNFFVFNSGEFLMNLKASKTVNVRVMGEVMNPGSFSVSSVNSVLNVLAKAGGFTPNGSLRNIQVIRNGKRIYVDFYQAIENPFGSFDPYVQENDLIFVPVLQKIVEAKNEVKRPGFYELKENEGLKELLEYSGGVSGQFSKNFIHIQHIQNGEIVLEDIAYEDFINKKYDIALNDQDIVDFPSYSQKFERFVELIGAFEYPGKYDLNSTSNLKMAFEKGIIKSDLYNGDIVIKRKTENKHFEFIHLDSTYFDLKKAEKILLNKEDEITIFSQKEFNNLFQVSIGGQVKKDTSFALFYNDKIPYDALLALANGYTEEASNKGYLIRINPLDKFDVQYQFLDLDKDFYLSPGDSLIVLNKHDFSFDFEVILSGEVKNPNSFKYSKDLKFEDLIRLAGGNTFNASKKVDLYRYKINQFGNGVFEKEELYLKDDFLSFQGYSEFKIQPYDRFVIRPILRPYESNSVKIIGEVIKPGPYYFGDKPYYFSDLLKDCEGLKETADINSIRIIKSSLDSVNVQFSYDQLLDNIHKFEYDPQLLNGDIIIVNKITNLVKIFNKGVNNASVDTNFYFINYAGNFNAKYYVQNYAGGFHRDADKNSLYVVKGNGKSVSTKNILFFRVYPKVNSGDEIRIGQYKKIKVNNSNFDWDKAFSKFLTLTSTFATAYFFFTRKI